MISPKSTNEWMRGQYGKSRNPEGRPPIHGEKKQRVNVSLTQEGIEGLDKLASERNLSRSEFIEQIGRRLIAIERSLAQEDRQQLCKSA
jgi:predicted HTH domain antitoxin